MTSVEGGSGRRDRRRIKDGLERAQRVELKLT